MTWTPDWYCERQRLGGYVRIYIGVRNPPDNYDNTLGHVRSKVACENIYEAHERLNAMIAAMRRYLIRAQIHAKTRE